ncbi:transcription antitermination factor NusB [Natronoflexus pectinivorans]|uniref:NusB antitermination factor n=1 Tax=Natronoflexus pectinivorans TaxID=682526 RepID=A0A4R2G6I3_9BACT|nr:transcription antitermination factor NusB [Natronoflexus pectinivorans]TCO03306.1 NusB antitermination factor [Natronoflexus pectinivorans]
MLSRRLLRVKVLQMAYAYSKRGDASIQEMEKELFHSISKSYELYHLILMLLTELHHYAELRIEKGKNKKVPSPQDLNPNTRFIDNAVLKQLIENPVRVKYQETTGLSWSNHPEIIKGIFSKIIDSDMYNDYMVAKDYSYDYQKRFIVKLTEKVIAQHEPLYTALEEQSIFWNDECEFIVSMVIKTLKEFSEEKGSEQDLQKEFKDEDDKEFVKTLFRKTLLNQKEFTELIKTFAQNWDLERVAFMDIVLMQIALAEIQEFPNIPIKVSLNEYIEIAKHYSTPKSGLFINGILDKITNHLKEEGKIKKQGRGLIE